MQLLFALLMLSIPNTTANHTIIYINTVVAIHDCSHWYQWQ